MHAQGAVGREHDNEAAGPYVSCVVRPVWISVHSGLQNDGHSLGFPKEEENEVANIALDTVCSQTLRISEQNRWVEQVRDIIKEAPLVRPHTPNGLPMRVRVSAAGALGWVGDGAYRYDETQKNGKAWPAIPSVWAEVASEVAGDQPWDSAIINWYDTDASLGWHQDKGERDLSLPIVTISLGDACSWAVQDDAGKAHRTRLESGDITLLAGLDRNRMHTVERIISAPLLSPLRTRGRISITMRVAG